MGEEGDKVWVFVRFLGDSALCQQRCISATRASEGGGILEEYVM